MSGFVDGLFEYTHLLLWVMLIIQPIYIRWNAYWDRIYDNVMAPSKKVIANAKKYNLPRFAAWAKLIRIMAVSKLTAIHGPVIYSNYGKTDNKHHVRQGI